MEIPQWHEADDFWETLGPVFFEAGRWASAPGEIDQIIDLASIAPGAAVLDLCCGPGRHALELARRGFAVTGVDRTASYLEIARGEAADLPIEFAQADMREFCRSEAFSVALNLYSSFGYFDDPADDRLVVDNLYHSLAPGGVLMIDLLSKEVLARNQFHRNWIEWDGGFLLESSQFQRDWTWLQNRWIVITQDGIGEYVRGHRLYAASELSALLTSAGFAKITLYGDLAGAPYNQAASRLVAVAHKPL